MVQVLSASDLLDVWESGIGRLPVEQALLLLRAVYPDTSDAELSRLSIGQRDAVLMRLRQTTFGSPLTGLANCPACGERLEIQFPLDELFSSSELQPDLAVLPVEVAPQHLSTVGYNLTFRLPNSADLLNAGDAPDPDAAVEALLKACLIETHRDGQPVRAADLPDEAIRALAIRMEEADPLANISLPLTCPACGHVWKVLFDIVSFFWTEISAWAQRLLREVHALASAYGWSERDILAMSAWRRQKYLELIGL